MEQNYELLSDEELFQLLNDEKGVAEKAFTELYNRYSPHVYAFCRRFLGNRIEAQDVFQETFLNFHQSIEKKRGLSNIKGYLLAIARNLCYNIKRNETFNITYDEYISVNDEDRKENDELLNLIKKSIELLSDEYREILILREYDGLSYSEIAEVTKNKINTVKVKLFRAKKQLRKILEPYLENLTNYE
jgi:RNA polymerase sigma factor (sigma-70 family)